MLTPWDEDKSNKLLSFQIYDDTILENYKKNWNDIEDLKSVELNALPVYGDRYIKSKTRT